ncbi:MAG TPA: transcriptional regulator [Rhodobacteraceae bacterium]|nr:transcriptional regulator [Paracoccaceae bacterium]
MNIFPNTHIQCIECPIRHRAVCARCDENELLVLEKMKFYKNYVAGEPILWQGDNFDYVASVVQGVATLGKTLEDGRTQLVGLLFGSDFIGRPGREKIDFDICAVTDVTLCCFRREPFEALISSTPSLADRLAEMALDELNAAREWMLLLGRKTAQEKIATFIEMLVRRQHNESLHGMKPKLSLPLTREEIANYLGLTIETVSRQITSFKNKGILEFSDRRNFKVKDMKALKLATGDDTEGGVII